jgi:hypothetical protein
MLDKKEKMFHDNTTDINATFREKVLFPATQSGEKVVFSQEQALLELMAAQRPHLQQKTNPAGVSRHGLFGHTTQSKPEQKPEATPTVPSKKR